MTLTIPQQNPDHGCYLVLNADGSGILVCTYGAGAAPINVPLTKAQAAALIAII